jgi:molybdate transport system substrate-binding protein
MKNIFVVLLAFAVLSVHAQEITIAAAADLHFALDEIGANFQNESGIRLRVSYGSSGNFYQQLQNGAPFDIFLSANVDYPKKLEAAGLTVPGSYYEYARGQIVLAVRANSTLDVKQGLKVLLNPAVKKIAIADPNHAPYGMAAVAALKAEKVYDQVASKLVTGENISQTASFVLSGAADVGIIALSLVKAPPNGAPVRFQEIPASDYPPIQQACVVLKSSKNPELAKKFEDYLRGKQAAEIFRRYGFDISVSSEH